MAGPAGAVRPVEKGVHPIPAMEPARCLEAHIDWHIYKERHLAEILFLKFKARCRFSTRYEKRAYLFLCHDCTAKRLELPLQRLPAVSREGQPQPASLQNALNKCAQNLTRKTKKLPPYQLNIPAHGQQLHRPEIRCHPTLLMASTV